MLGNWVEVIEHNLEVIKTADWIIDLGPEGGDGGGEIVAAGTPEDIVREKRSYTGAFLKPVLARGSETVGGDNPTPDQSDVEENAHAIGINFEDNQQLNFQEQMERRDSDRFELDERSKATDESI